MSVQSSALFVSTIDGTERKVCVEPEFICESVKKLRWSFLKDVENQ